MKKIVLAVMAATALCTALAQNREDEKAIEKIVGSMEEGWVQKDGEKFASVFADTHDYIVWNGYYFRNTTKAMTAASHQGLFNGPFKMMDIKLKVDKIKFIRPDIALTHVLGVSYEKGKEVPKDPGVLMSLLLEKKDSKWQILSFHNLDLEAFQDKETGDRSLMPLNIMYASWYKK